MTSSPNSRNPYYVDSQVLGWITTGLLMCLLVKIMFEGHSDPRGFIFLLLSVFSIVFMVICRKMAKGALWVMLFFSLAMAWFTYWAVDSWVRGYGFLFRIDFKLVVWILLHLLYPVQSYAFLRVLMTLSPSNLVDPSANASRGFEVIVKAENDLDQLKP